MRNGCNLVAVPSPPINAARRLSGQTISSPAFRPPGRACTTKGLSSAIASTSCRCERQFPDGVTFLEAARKTQQLLLDAADHQSYIFGSLVRALDMPREVNRLPLIEAQFNLERIGQNLPFQDLAVRPAPIPSVL